MPPFCSAHAPPARRRCPNSSDPRQHHVWRPAAHDADSDEAAPLFRDDCAPGFRDDLAPC
ncbi:hypothetical protein GOB98_30175, partial [Sinorhizobium meliloti]|nr:hypothetical protein [Sinorhizobium meliloti]MDX0296860.1 hypothetical protein [Sinorhizobium meliloti]